jgi:hypothetical protein
MGRIHSFAFVSFDDALKKVRELRKLRELMRRVQGGPHFSVRGPE